MAPKPRMEVHAPRSIIRHSVEMALKQLGIMDFVDEMMYEELKEKTDKLMDILCQKFNNMLRSNIKARDIFGKCPPHLESLGSYSVVPCTLLLLCFCFMFIMGFYGKP
jgi:hypothetical protein